MLIGFRVKNYLSFGDEAVLSFLKNNDICNKNAAIKINEDVELYKIMVVYGANAAGKSNLINALYSLKKMVVLSAKESVQGEELPVKAFRLNKNGGKEPTEFSIALYIDGCQYVYNVSLNKFCILKESLSAYPKGREQVWYVREKCENGEYIWKFGKGLKGNKTLWKTSTRDNALFLSTAVQLNSEQLRVISNWFANKLVVLRDSNVREFQTLSLLENRQEIHQNVVNFLRNADNTLTDIRVIKSKLNDKKLKGLPQELKDVILKGVGDKEVAEVRTSHVGTEGELVDFSFEEESTGTRKVFSLAAPFFRAADNGVVIVADELDTHLHPLLYKSLLSFFVGNSGNSQLMFTTHNTSYLSDKNLFDREQIWFVKRNGVSLSSELYSLGEFKPLADGDENYESMYLDGRYGATPKWNNVV